MNILNDKVDKLVELKKSNDFNYTIQAVINIENGRTPGIYMQLDVIKFSNDIGATIDIDLYLMS